MVEFRHPLVIAAVKPLFSLGLYVLIAWDVFFHDGSASGIARFWPPGEVYQSYRLNESHWGVFDNGKFVLAYMMLPWVVIEYVQVYRKARRQRAESLDV